jgi:hypothetical protein
VGTFASGNPGENIPVSISGISLAGEDASDYEIDDMGLTGTILRTSMNVESDEFGMITIISPNGFDSDLTVTVQAARDAITFNDLSRKILNADSSQTVRAIFNVLFLKNGQAVSFNQPFTMTVTIPETYRNLKQMRLYHVSETGDIHSDDLRNGNQMTIDGESINFYVFTSSPVNLMSFLIIALVSILMIVVVVILHVRRYQLSLHYKRS